MTGNQAFACSLFVIFALISWFGLRPFHGFRKTKAKTLDEFAKFIQEQDCQYVAIHTVEDLVAYSSDCAKTKFYVVASTMNPFGFKFTYHEKISTLPADCSIESFEDSRKACTQRANEIHKVIKDSLSAGSKPFLISLQGKVA